MGTVDPEGTRLWPGGQEPADAEGQQELERGALVGRYLIIETLGRGGMGVVYRAYDPELNRPVALKLIGLHGQGSQSHQGGEDLVRARMLREAQALAQLTHPNVVSVYDVGAFDQAVFITMELVEGQTLRDWAAQQRPSRAQVLDVLVAAGRGLAAAHDAGLVHRDFKPSNVVVGTDGRVRVIDFGLARQWQRTAVEPPTPERDSEASDSVGLLANGNTRVGALPGTPAYMAPEQHRVGGIDHRADQFSFCVVLFQLLRGQHPAPGESSPSWTARLGGDHEDPVLAEGDLPAWLYGLIRRGVSPEPEDRHSSMAVLLDQLENDPEGERLARRRQRQGWALAALAAVMATTLAAGLWWYSVRSSRRAHCALGAAEIANVWNAATKTSMRAAMVATEAVFAVETAQSVGNLLDTYATSWARMHQRSCEAARIAGSQSLETMERRMLCLQRRKRALALLADMLTQGDAGVVTRAINAASKLESIATCADFEGLRISGRRQAQRQGSESSDDRVSAVRDQLQSAKLMMDAGKYDAGLAIVDAVLPRVMGMHHLRLEAEVRARQGVIYSKKGNYDKAEPCLRQAYNIAAATHYDAIMAQAAIAMIDVSARRARHEDGAHWDRLAEHVAAGSQEKADWLNASATLMLARGEHDKALHRYQRSRQLLAATLGPDHPESVGRIYNVASAHFAMGAHEQALRHYRDSLRRWQKVVGREHPMLAGALTGVGNVLLERQEYGEAKRFFDRANSIWKRAAGPRHPMVAVTLVNIGASQRGVGDLDGALESYNRANEVFKEVFAADHPDLAWALAGAGETLLEAGRVAEALIPLRRAVEICEHKVCSPDPHGSALVALAKGLALLRMSRARSVALGNRAREVFREPSQRFREQLQELQELHQVLQP